MHAVPHIVFLGWPSIKQWECFAQGTEIILHLHFLVKCPAPYQLSYIALSPTLAFRLGKTWTNLLSYINLGDNCIQNFHLGRYIVGNMVWNLVLRRRASSAVKRDIRKYIRRYTSPNENFEYGYPHSNALLKKEHCKPDKATCRQTKCDVINDVKLFLTVYHRIYCRKFLTLSNQTSRYICKCIRIACYWKYEHSK